MELKKLPDRIYYLPNEEANDRPVLGYINGQLQISVSIFSWTQSQLKS